MARSRMMFPEGLASADAPVSDSQLHVYALPRRLDLIAGAEEKAILFEADRVAFEKTYHLDSQANVHATNGELVRLKMGRAVDVIARRKRTNYQMRGLPKGMAEAAYEIRLNNSKREKITGEVRENMVGEWRILSKFLPDERNTDRCAQWHIEMLAEGEAILQYSVHSKFRQV